MGREVELTSLEKVKNRLALGVSLMEELERRRREKNSRLIGAHIECLIVAEEIWELEQDIRQDPGALECYFPRVKE